MDNTARLWILLLMLGVVYRLCHGLRCYTCSVDFRSEPFSINNTCIFPKDHDDLGHCSHNSKFCKAVITRVFVMLQRSCSDDCMDACTEKGYGVRIRDCTKCCVDNERCGSTELIRERKQKRNIGCRTELQWIVWWTVLSMWKASRQQEISEGTYMKSFLLLLMVVY